jgi:hypothetical protein
MVTISTCADPALVKARARAFRYQRMLDAGQYASITEIERLDRGYMGRLLQLTMLAPDIVEAILNEMQPNGIDLPRFMELIPAGWTDQQAFFAQLPAA